MKQITKMRIALTHLALLGLISVNFYAGPLTEQQNQPTKEPVVLVQKAIAGVDGALRQVGTALLEIEKGEKADRKLIVNSVCIMLAMVVGKASVNSKICTNISVTDANGSTSYVQQLEGVLSEKLKSDPPTQEKEKQDLDAIVQVTIPNIKSYLIKANDTTIKEVITMLDSGKSLALLKDPVLTTMAFLSAAKGRVKDEFAYGGLLYVQDFVQNKLPPGK